MILWFVAYGWIIVTGFMHFIIDVISQYVRGIRVPSTETTFYYGMNTAVSLGQIILGVFGLILAQKAPQLLNQWPAVILTVTAAVGWLAISFIFLPYKEPKFISAISALLVIAAAVSSLVIIKK
ncbi:hypothetical protein ACFFSY_34765 [Paenibacillus aurantiacus]|uniref:Uncharacterized protein n=1 Tax=Paenibacillus aurantiacus TaxID=1936118 RepID=A0ABV5L0Y8_9BACL